MLLEHQGLTLGDLLPPDEVDAAVTMLAADEEAVKGDVQKAVGIARAAFDALDPSDRADLVSRAEEQEAELKNASGVTRSCPACGAPGRIEGERVSVSETKLQDEMLHWETVILPTGFECLACTLQLSGYDRLEAAGLGGQYVVEHWADPVEHYGEQAIEAYMEPDYGND